MKNLILFQNGSIGDFLMALFLAQNLFGLGTFKRVYIVVPRNKVFLQGLSSGYPYVSIIQCSLKHPFGLFKLLPKMFSRNTIIMPPTPGFLPFRLKLFARALSFRPASQTIGFIDTFRGSSLYSKSLIYNTAKSYVDTLGDIITMFGLTPILPPALCLGSAINTKELDSDVKKDQYLFFHPFGSAAKRSFSNEAIAEFVRVMGLKHPELKIVLSGGPADIQKIEDIKKNLNEFLKDKDQVKIVAAVSAEKLISLICGARLFVGVDTGITHLACFLQKPALVVAHHGTVNWLPYYHRGAKIIYRLEEESVVRDDKAYLEAHRSGRLKPFTEVPTSEVINFVEQILS